MIFFKASKIMDKGFFKSENFRASTTILVLKLKPRVVVGLELDENDYGWL